MFKLYLLVLACLFLSACSPEQTGLAESGGFAGLPPGAEGIDLSHHNGRVDWDMLDQSTVDFLYLKATEGSDWKDPRFQDHWLQATRRGWHVGAYHFYRLCRPGAEQAANFIQSVEVRTGTLPPAVDLEYAHNCRPLDGPARTLDELRIFLAALEAEYGARPVLYTTPEFHADWLDGQFQTYPVWVRGLDGPPATPHAIWQYSMRGQVPGIDGPVDLNRVPEIPPAIR